MSENKKDRPPYLIGLLCIFPFIGFLVGIALILYGVFRYKDKLLVAIGVLGIVITIGFYSYLFLGAEYGKTADRQLSDISRTELNDLVKDIEFYNIQRGQYPDSLDQLTENNKFVSIIDPFLTRKANRHISILFQYHKVSDKYTVFSVGPDGVPNTPDDIYPSIVDSGTNKLGLIRK